MRMKVVLPVPFSPSMTTICESENSPFCTRSVNVGAPGLPSRRFFIAGYVYLRQPNGTKDSDAPYAKQT